MSEYFQYRAYNGGDPNHNTNPDPNKHYLPYSSLRIECLCGQITGSIEGYIGPHRVCHCWICKKVTGGTHANMLAVREVMVILDRKKMGATHIEPTSEDMRPLRVYRCRECGTPIYYKGYVEYPAVLDVFVGCLKHTEYLETNQPVVELNSHEKLAWLPPLVREPAPSEAVSPGQNPDEAPAQGSDEAASQDSDGAPKARRGRWPRLNWISRRLVRRREEDHDVSNEGK